MNVRPVFWFLLGFVLVLLVMSDRLPALTLVVAAVIVTAALVALVLAVFWAAERSDGRA